MPINQALITFKSSGIYGALQQQHQSWECMAAKAVVVSQALQMVAMCRHSHRTVNRSRQITNFTYPCVISHP